ncbi:hypothetical protein G5I77_004044 [Escherichia coli]|nr:hypothetical protein [Escherichia coli]
MHEKNIALLCDEADRLLQLNINLLRQMVEEPDVLSDSKNENRLLFDKQNDAPRDKCTLSCAINGIHAAFHYLKKNYISGCVMTVPTG